MVVFTCNHCGDSLQKPKAEKHYETKCRNRFPNLCCVDCLKDFHGDEFKAHTKCVTEAERYGGKGYVAKTSQNKGERKQNTWVEIVQSALEENTGIPGSVTRILEKISIQPNTPRKKAKFINFVKNIDKKASLKDVETAWDLLSSKLGQLSAVCTENASKATNGSANNESKENEVEDVCNKENNNETENTSINESVQESPKVKKKKTKKHSNDSEVNGEEGDEPSHNVDEEAGKTLSKKELKEKKKREKYENELKEIETAQVGLDESIEVKKSRKRKHADEAKVKKQEKLEPKSKKVKKTDASNDNEPAAMKEVVENDHMEVEFESEDKDKTVSVGKNKKKDKSGKPKKVTNDSAGKFDWQGAILSVLGSKGKDIAVKKLQKRVLAEYCAENSVTEISERIMKKFNKGLYKIPNVKIENDKVFLTVED